MIDEIEKSGFMVNAMNDGNCDSDLETIMLPKLFIHLQNFT